MTELGTPNAVLDAVAAWPPAPGSGTPRLARQVAFDLRRLVSDRVGIGRDELGGQNVP